jgi:hypothetical protein
MAKGRDITTDAEIDAALERAKNQPELPRALSAEYNADSDVVVLHIDDGSQLSIPRKQLQGLENATEAQISQIEIFAGLDIAWPQLDLDHYLPALLQGIYGSDKWMSSLGRRGVAA